MKRGIAAALAAVSLMTGSALLAPRASLKPAWAQAYVNGAPAVPASVGWNEFLGYASAAGQTYAGTVRAGGSIGGTASTSGYFQATCFSTVAATCNLYSYATAGGTPTLVSSGAIAANAAVTLKAPAFGAAFVTLVTNGAAAGSFSVFDGFTGS